MFYVILYTKVLANVDIKRDKNNPDQGFRVLKSTFASVAQGIEQRFPVPRGGGSNPSRCVFRIQKKEDGAC